MTNVTVSGNSALNGVGGGISNDGTLTLTNATVSDNAGGGIANNGTATLTNVTLSGNTGGGIESGTATLTNVTLSGNTTSGFGGGIANAFVTLTNVLLAGNTASLGGDNCYRGITTSLGHNLSSDASCGFAGPGDLNNTNPLLGPLADNGGPTQTHALLPGSPAIDAGTNTGCPAADQRGITRPQGSACDIGAFEVVSTSSPGPTGPANARQILNVGTFVGPTVPPTPQQQQQTFRPTDPLLAGATYYDPADACAGVAPAGVKFFVFTLEGQLILGRNRDTGGVSSTQIGTSKYQALLATVEPGALPPGAYNLVFWVKDCTNTDVLVSEFVAIQVLSP